MLLSSLALEKQQAPEDALWPVTAWWMDDPDTENVRRTLNNWRGGCMVPKKARGTSAAWVSAGVSVRDAGDRELTNGQSTALMSAKLGSSTCVYFQREVFFCSSSKFLRWCHTQACTWDLTSGNVCKHIFQMWSRERTWEPRSSKHKPPLCLSQPGWPWQSDPPK